MTFGKMILGAALAMSLAGCAGEPANNDPVTDYTWIDWTEVSDTEAKGNAGRIKVTYEGDLNPNSDIGDKDRHEWEDYPNTFGFEDLVEAPIASDILRTNGGEETGEQVITFSYPVTDPIIAIFSLGASGEPAHILFENEVEVLVKGPASWGNGQLYVSQGEALAINGQEGNGLIRMPGTYTQITFTTPQFESDFGYQFAVKEQ